MVAAVADRLATGCSPCLSMISCDLRDEVETQSFLDVKWCRLRAHCTKLSNLSTCGSGAARWRTSIRTEEQPL